MDEDLKLARFHIYQLHHRTLELMSEILRVFIYLKNAGIKKKAVSNIFNNCKYLKCNYFKLDDEQLT